MLIEYFGSTSSAGSQARATRRRIAQVWKPSVIELAATRLERRWKNWENSCGEMFLKDTCWHLSAGCSQVHRLLQRGWIPPHSAVCKELFSSPGIICGSTWWGIYSFWHGGEKWEHLKGLICHSLSWEGKKMYYHRGHWPWSLGYCAPLSCNSAVHSKSRRVLSRTKHICIIKHYRR